MTTRSDRGTDPDFAGDGRETPAARAYVQRRQQILDSTLATFNAEGCFRTSLNSIVADAGVGKSTLYRHFRSDIELYDAARRQGLQELERLCHEAWHRQGGDSDASLRALLAVLLTHNVQRSPVSLPVLARLSCCTTWLNSSRPSKGDLDNHLAILPFVRLAQAGGALDPSAEPHWISVVVLALVSCPSVVAFAPDGVPDGSVDEVVERVFQTVRHVFPPARTSNTTNRGAGARVTNAKLESTAAGDLCRGTLDALSAHIAVLDTRGIIVATNRAWRQFAVLNGQPWGLVSEGAGYLAVCDRSVGSSSEGAADMAAAIRDMLAGRLETFVLEYPCHSPGERRWFLARLTRFSLKDGPRVVVSHQEITSRRLAEDAKLKAQRRFEDLFEQAPDAMVITDGEGLIRQVNRRAERVFGYERVDLLNRPVEMLMPEPTRKGHIGLRRKYLDSAVPREMGATSGRAGLRGRRRDGTEFPVEISLSPLGTGAEISVVAAVRDVTERRQLEEQLRQSQKLETVGQLAGGVAHDFNNLLSVINATADLASLPLPKGDPTRDDLDTILSAGKKAAALTQQLLAFSRKQILQPVVVDLETIVARMIPLVRRLVGEHITIAAPGGAGRGLLVLVDPPQMDQVVMNLVVNAQHAMPDGGTMTIEVAAVTLDDACADVHSGIRPGTYACLSVSDTGIGMDGPTRERIFEPFFTTKALGSGTGLGLATVFGIVNQFGGEIACYSEPGKGATFKIYLPIADAEEHEDDAQVKQAPQRQGAATILVIEDEAELRRVAERILVRHGYVVLLAAGGDDALELLAHHEGPVDLVLTDVVMPGMSGREVAKRIKTTHPSIKILFTSGYTDDAIVQHGVLEPGVQFIGKPYAVSELSQKVWEVLNRE